MQLKSLMNIPVRHFPFQVWRSRQLKKWEEICPYHTPILVVAIFTVVFSVPMREKCFRFPSFIIDTI